jgi:hypothetical protein
MSERNVVWGDALKLQLIRRFAAEELGISDDAFEER